MADPATPTPEDPFAQIDPGMTAASAKAAPASADVLPASAPVANDNNEPANPFADLGPEAGPGQSGAVGSFARGAEKGALPAAGTLAGAGFGAELGSAAGLPLAPFTAGWSVPVLGTVGGLVGGFGGGAAVQGAQNWALKHLPDSWSDSIGFSDRQTRLDEAQHSGASFLGGLAPYAVTMSPNLAFRGAAKDLPENATALQRILAHPATAKLFGGALMGGMEAGNEKLSGEDLNWRKTAVATVFGTIFNKPNGIGEAITEAGAHPTRTVLGRPHPTLAQAADLKVMGPGITESVFQGTQEHAPDAAMTAQENARVEAAALGEGPEPDLHAIAAKMEPETFQHYEELLKQRDTLAAWHGEGTNAEVAEKHLAATEAQIRELSPEIAAAYRRARDTVGTGEVEAEPFPSLAHMLAAHESGTGGVSHETTAPEENQAQPAVSAAAEPGAVPATEAAPTGVPVPQRTIGEQRAFIAGDVTQKLIAAGRPAEEAQAAGHLIAARYVTRAGRFEGKLGSAEELYAKEGAAIAGPNERPQAPAIAPQEPVLPSPDAAAAEIPGEAEATHAEPVQAAFEAVDHLASLSPAEQKRALPEYSPAAETAPKGPDQPAGVFMFDPTKLNVDATQFQFKSGGDEYGVTGALRNVTKWDPAKAQSIIVWEQNDGQLFVADGHQRAGLARRLTEKEGAKGIELPGVLYREKDGVSADDIRAMAAVTNIANGSGSAIDGAKVLRARPDLMDGSLPLSTGKGKQAAALARLGDEPFRMVLNEVIPEHYGAIVGELIPHDAARQEAAVKAIARFEPKNADEAAALTQRVAQAELAKAEEGKQTSMFGDLETAESTAGEEMKIVGRAIADLKKDKGLFARVLANAERIEQTGSRIERETAAGIATDSEIFAKTLASDAYAAGPLRNELVKAARDLKNGKATVSDASTRIIAAIRAEVEAHGLNRPRDLGGVEPQALELAQRKEVDRETVDQFETNLKERLGLSHLDLQLHRGDTLHIGMIEVPKDVRKQGVGTNALQEIVKFADEHGLNMTLTPGVQDDLHGTTSRSRLVKFYRQFGFVENKGRNKDFAISAGMMRPASKEFEQRDQTLFEPGAEGKPQALIPGIKPVSQRDLIQQAAAKPLAPKVVQKPAGGLFGDSMDQKEMFQSAYHGSPYHFDMFDTGKIGTGEGAQSYGHGLYFAENEKVARDYQKGVIDQKWFDQTNARLSQIAKEMEPEKIPGSYDKFKTQKGRDLKAEYDRLMQERADKKGNLYHVNIKPEPHEFLQWDKALNEQTPEVRAKIDETMERVAGIKNYTDNENLGSRSLSSLIYDLSHKSYTGSAAGASKALAESGLPGIRYADQGSRGPRFTVNRAEFPGAGQQFETRDAAENYIADRVKKDGELASRFNITETPQTHNYVVFDPNDIEILDRNGKKVTEAEYNQTARGKIRISEGRRPIITLMKDANASTFMHESGHQFLEELMRDADHPEAPDRLRADAKITLDYLGVDKPEDIKTKHHEKFARGFEQYLREGIAPSKELAGVFAKFRNWLLSIYQSIKGLGTEISPDIRGVFDRMLEMEPQRTIISPHERPPGGPLLHEIHTADAEHTEPHEAAAVYDRTKAEFDRYIAEPPPDIAHEINPVAEKVEAEIAARAAGTNAGAEAVGGTSPAPEVVGSGGGPESKPEGGGVGAGRGELSGDIGKPAAESPELQRPDARAKLGDNPGTALAPGPADLFGNTDSGLIDKAGNIVLKNLNSPEEVLRAFRESAGRNNDFIGDRRGVVTPGQVMDLARQLGMEGAQDIVDGWVKGRALNAEQIVAVRLLARESATSVHMAYARAAASGAEADIIAQVQAEQRHDMIQGVLSGATAEWGRAGSAFKMLKEDAGGKTASQLIQEATGKTLFQAMQRAKLGTELKTPEQVAKFMNDAKKRNFASIVLEYWINGLISGPATHMTYMAGNTISAIMKLPETAAAAGAGRVASALGREGTGVRLGEVGAMVRGAGSGIAPAVKAGIEAARTGVTTALPGEGPEQTALPFQPGSELAQPAQMDETATFHQAMSAAYGLVQGMKDTVISHAALVEAGGIPGESLFSRQWSPNRSTPDIAFRGVTVLPTGAIATLPSRGVAVIHSFFRSLVFSMEKNAMAYRKAAEEGFAGAELHARVAQIRSDPSETMMNELAAHEATETALMGKGSELTQRLAALTNTPIFGSPLLKFIDPFVRVSGNIIDQSLIRRTPVGLLTLFGPETELARDLTGKNGNVAQDKAIGRMMVGTALAVTFGSLAAQKMISGSGPKDPKEANVWRMAGNQPHSVRIGDTWYQVNKLGPMGMLASLSADLYDVAHEAEQGEFTKAGAHLLHAITQNVLDESAMHGPAELLKAIETPDRYGESYIRNYLAAFVPFSVGMGQIGRAQDPYQRDVRTMIDAIRNKIPGHLDSYFGNELPVRRDIWGEPLPSRTALGGASISAIYEQKINTDPVNAAMFKVGVFPGSVERKIHNVDLSADQYDDFARLSGRMAKMRLDKMVISPQFLGQTPSVQHDWMTEVIKQSRESARQMMMIKNPEIIRKSLEAKQAKKQAINDREAE